MDHGGLSTETRTLHATAVSAGTYHSLALNGDGTVWAWGYNGRGELGDGTGRSSTTPVQVVFPAGVSITAVSAGGIHSLAVDSDGVVWSWGGNDYGQVGNGTTTTTYAPGRVFLADGTPLHATSISAGSSHSLAVDANNGGRVYAWGNNSNGQLGIGSTTDSTWAAPVVLANNQGAFRATTVSAGAYHSLAIDASGDHTVYAWGSNAGGQLGNGTSTDASYPGRVLVDDSHPLHAVAIAAGGYHSLAIDAGSDRDVWAWGYNNRGQVGRGTSGDRSLRPVQVTFGDGSPLRASALAAGDAFSLAIDATPDRNVYSWGYNASGQLGDGSNTSSPVPVLAVFGGTDRVTAATASASATSALVVASDGSGRIYGWGENTYAQLGNGNAGTGSESNVAVATIITNRTACPLGSGRLIGTSQCSLVAGANYSYTVTTTVGGWTAVSAPLTVTTKTRG